MPVSVPSQYDQQLPTNSQWRWSMPLSVSAPETMTLQYPLRMPDISAKEKHRNMSAMSHTALTTYSKEIHPLVPSHSHYVSDWNESHWGSAECELQHWTTAYLFLLTVTNLTSVTSALFPKNQVTNMTTATDNATKHILWNGTVEVS